MIATRISVRTACFLLFAVLFSLSIPTTSLRAQNQPSLSVQGILKKSNGVAVEDGVYSIKFKLYTAATGGTVVWEETQSDIEVSNGIYSAILGTVNSLAGVPFTQLYHLGVTIGSTELSPRVLLTSAPYALSLIGATNTFPSSGKVVADSIQANGGVLASGGAPGANGASRHGYAFSGNGGDKDSGLFSTGNGKVSLYADNTEVLAATPTGVDVNGTLEAGSLALPNGGSVSYNGKKDWRLVYEDDLTNGPNGWKYYAPAGGHILGWSNPTEIGPAPVEGSPGNFVGFYLYPTHNDQVFKKYFDLSGVGNYTKIMVKFKYHLIDSWGFGDDDRAWAAFAESASGSQMRIGWDAIPSTLASTVDLTSQEFDNVNNYAGQSYPDFFIDGEMTAYKSGTGFWLFFGGALDQDLNDESWGVGMIEVWVK